MSMLVTNGSEGSATLDGSEGSATLDAPRSKQERIRENQRRSRARRQEYLADLERRLNECHTTCREADLQRAAFADLQAENARLRDLLKSVGISPDLVETYGRQNMLERPSDITAPSLRQIKPKLQTAEIPKFPPALKQKSNSGACCSTPPSSSCCTPQPPVSTENFQVHDNQCRYQLIGPPTAPAPTMSSMTNVSPGTSDEWFYSSASRVASASSDNFYICDTFLVPPKGPLLLDDGNTVSCSVAKVMIEQYNPTLGEMEEIVARLATAFAQPTFPETNCRVHNQALFQILSEMNAKQTHGRSTIRGI